MPHMPLWAMISTNVSVTVDSPVSLAAHLNNPKTLISIHKIEKSAILPFTENSQSCFPTSQNTRKKNIMALR